MNAREATSAEALRLMDLINAAYREAEGHFISGQRPTGTVPFDDARLNQPAHVQLSKALLPRL